MTYVTIFENNSILRESTFKFLSLCKYAVKCIFFVSMCLVICLMTTRWLN